MNKSYLSLLCCGVTALAAAVEPIVPAPITGLTLFKNGLAVVERVAKPGPGRSSSTRRSSRCTERCGSVLPTA